VIGKRKRPADFNARAASVVADATGQQPDEPSGREKNPHAVALGRLGGLKGGKARAEKLSAERRREIARNARAARKR
jgi:hypothetical protein